MTDTDVLDILADQSAPVRLGHIAELAHISVFAASAHLRNLIKAGAVVRPGYGLYAATGVAPVVQAQPVRPRTTYHRNQRKADEPRKRESLWTCKFPPQKEINRRVDVIAERDRLARLAPEG